MRNKLVILFVFLVLLIFPVSADYTLNFEALTNSPADSVTNYVGILPNAPTTTVNLYQQIIPTNGYIDIAEIYDYSGTAGTNQAYTYYLRINNTQDFIVSTLSVAATERVFSNTSMWVQVFAGDTIEAKRIHPVWTTNPLTNVVGGYIHINTSGIDRGYTLRSHALTNSPADSVNNYIGLLPAAPSTTQGINKVYLQTDGAITSAFANDYSGTAGTAEAYSYYIDNVSSNNTLIETISASASQRLFDNATLAMPVQIGDTLQFKRVHPAWATNPLTNIVGGTMFINTTSSIFTSNRYPLFVQALTSSPADSQTVYFGNTPSAPSATAGISKIYIRQPGIITGANIYTYSGTAGTSEPWSLYIIKNNVVSDLISTKSVSANERVFENTNLNIPVVAGDYIQIKSVQPAWATNPATTIYGGNVYIMYEGAPPEVSFSSNVTHGLPPLPVSFTDSSITSITGWSWAATNTDNGTTMIFSTGSGTPVQTFDTGHWDIHLTATNSSNARTSVSDYVISVNPSDGYGGTVQQDIWMVGNYLQTFHLKDSNTNSVIGNFTLYVDGGITTTTYTNGTGFLMMPFGSATITFSADGYYSRTITYVFDSDESHNVLLTKIQSPYIQNSNTLYSPKQISVTVKSYATANTVANANISLVAVGSSISSESIQTLYGMNADAANTLLNGTLIMATLTGTDGAADFTVLSSVRYTATVVDPTTATTYTATLHPGLDPYTIWIGTSPVAVSDVTVNALNQTRLWFTQPDPGNVTLHMQYRDLTSKTTSVNFTVKFANNMTILYDEQFLNPGTSVVLANHTHRNIRGQGYFWYYNATRVI